MYEDFCVRQVGEYFMSDWIEFSGELIFVWNWWWILNKIRGSFYILSSFAMT